MLSLAPVTVVCFFVVIQVEEDLRLSPERRAGHGGQAGLASQLVIVLVALYVSLVPTVLVVGLLNVATRLVPFLGAVLIALVALAFVRLRLDAGILRLVGGEAVSESTPPRGRRSAAVPFVLRAAFDCAVGIGWLGGALLSMLDLGLRPRALSSSATL